MARLEQGEEATRVIALARCFCEVVRASCVTHGARSSASCKSFEAWLRQERHCGRRGRPSARHCPPGAMPRPRCKLPGSSSSNGSCTAERTSTYCLVACCSPSERIVHTKRGRAENKSNFSSQCLIVTTRQAESVAH